MKLAGCFHEVAGMSIVAVAVHICVVDTLTVDSRVTLNILTLGQVFLGEGLMRGIQNTSARLCAKF